MSTKLNDVSIPDNASDSERTLAQTICRLSVSKGARDYTSEEYQTLYERFLRLGNIYVAKKAYPKAVALYNMSLRIARDKLNLSTKVTGEVELRLLETEQKFLKSVLKDNAPILNHDAHQKQIKGYKDHLEQFREATRQALKVAYEEIQKVKNERGPEEAEKRKVELIREIFKNIAAEIKRFIQILLKDCFDILGKSPCGYAIVGLGSLAREEATPYSDFEFAILISDEGKGGKNKEYFRHLNDFLHLKVINLGETIIPAMAIESLNPTHGRSTDFFFDDITPRGFAFDGAMPQACKTPHGKKDVDGRIIFELIQTPEKMAAYHGKTTDGHYWFEVDPHLTFALANMVCLDGNNELVRDYQKRMWEVLNQPLDAEYTKELIEKQYSLGQYIALKMMQENSKIFNPYLYKFEDAGRLFDAKKDLYRIPNLIIDALSLFYGLKHFCNSGYKLERLCVHGVLKSEVIEKLNWVLMETVRFRLDTYLYYKAQREQMNPLLNYFVVQAANQPTKDSKQSLDKQFTINENDLESLKKIYQVLIPLQDAISELIQGDEGLLKGLHFKVDFFIQGNVFVRLLQYSRAIESFQKALEENVKLHGEEDFIVALICNSIGTTLHAVGDVKEAVKYHDRALAIRIKIYGPEHHAVATSYNNLGLAWQALGDVNRAVEHYEKTLSIQIKLFGPEHPNVATSYNNLGGAWKDLGNVKKAVEYHEKALATTIKLYGPEHPNIVTSYNNLGSAWQALGDAKKAVLYHEKALAIQIKLYGTEHPAVAISYNNLGDVWQALGNSKKAAEYIEKALVIQIKAYGSEHPNVATNYNNLGEVYRVLGDARKALEYHEKASAIKTKLYGPEHPDVATSYNNLGETYRVLGDAKKAVEYHEKAFAIKIKHYGPEHPDVAASYNNLGLTWQALGDASRAVECHEQALMIKIKLHGPNHPDVSITYNNLGGAWEDLGNAKKAVEYFDKALKILSKIYDPNHPDLKQTRSNRDAALHFLNQQTKNQKEKQLNNDLLIFPLPETSKDYIRRLQLVLNESIVQVDSDKRTVSFPIFWLRQLGDGAIDELSRELQDNKLLPAFKRKL